MLKPFKTPSIVRPKNGLWFVKYFYADPEDGTFKEFRVKEGINRIKDPVVKEKEIIRLCKVVTAALESGEYNPFEVTTEVAKNNTERLAEFAEIDAKPGKWTLETGLDNFIEYCHWKELSPKTISSYKTFINNFIEWLTTTGKLNYPANEYLETDLIKFVNIYYEEEEWTPRTYNNHVDIAKTVFKRMEILERKTDRGLKYHINLEDLELKTDKAEKNRAYSGIVAERVKTELTKPKYKNLNNYIQFIYFSCMRPKEIRLLQIQHIDIVNRQIKVAGPTGKTGDRFVPISDELEQLLIELDFHKLPLNHFLIGKGGESSAEPFKRDYFSDIYYKIKVSLGLDIQLYTLYGFKHTRVIDLINAGFKDSDIMFLTGHRDYKAFLAYKRDLVVDNSTMKGKTVKW